MRSKMKHGTSSFRFLMGLSVASHIEFYARLTSKDLISASLEVDSSYFRFEAVVSPIGKRFCAAHATLNLHLPAVVH